jgi:Zn-dependent protease with chaperone function
MDAPTRGTGIYFDGVSGARQTVTVDLEADAIAVTSQQGSAIARWPYAELEREMAPQHRLRLGLAGREPPARLSIPDAPFAEAVKERLGVLTLQIESKERRQRHRVVEWTLAALAAVLILGIAGMPTIADLTLPLVPASAEQTMGKQVDDATRAAFKGAPPFECGVGPNEKEGQAAFLKMMGKLETAADLPVRLRPVVVREPKTINASAGPGGYVYVFEGIIRLADDPNELAGVLAHELGHVAHRDSARRMVHNAGIAYLFGVALGDFFGSGALFVSSLEVLNARNSRMVEAAADAYGSALMAKVGADPHALAGFFDKMTKAGHPGSNALLSDHPVNDARIAAINATPVVAKPEPILSPQEWQALKRVCADSKPEPGK